MCDWLYETVCILVLDLDQNNNMMLFNLKCEIGYMKLCSLIGSKSYMMLFYHKYVIGYKYETAV